VLLDRYHHCNSTLLFNLFNLSNLFHLLNSGIALKDYAGKLPIAMSATTKLKRNQGLPVSPTNIPKKGLGKSKCVICTKLGRVLDCCKAAHGLCSLCTEIHCLLTQEVAEHADQISQVLTQHIEQANELRAWEAHCQELEARIECVEAQLKAAQDSPEKLAEEI
jgi:hypothetical protein